MTVLQGDRRAPSSGFGLLCRLPGFAQALLPLPDDETLGVAFAALETIDHSECPGDDLGAALDDVAGFKALATGLENALTAMTDLE